MPGMKVWTKPPYGLKPVEITYRPDVNEFWIQGLYCWKSDKVVLSQFIPHGEYKGLHVTFYELPSPQKVYEQDRKPKRKKSE